MAIRKWCVKFAVGPPEELPIRPIVNAAPSRHNWRSFGTAGPTPSRVTRHPPPPAVPPRRADARSRPARPRRPEPRPTGAPRNRALVWFRRDLRDFDNAALCHALCDAREVYCAFVFDRGILDALRSPVDRRVEFIRESLVELDTALRARGGALIVRYAFAREAIPQLAAELGVQTVYANRDYEPAACDRDAAVAHALADRGVAFRTCKDQVIFERDEILTQGGGPFSVFTPYKNAWLKALTPAHLQAHAVDGCAGALAVPSARIRGATPTLESMGFQSTDLGALGVRTGMSGGAALFADFGSRIDRYRDARDFPAAKGPSYLSVHLRFGTVSVRVLAAYAHQCSLQPDGAGAPNTLSTRTT